MPIRTIFHTTEDCGKGVRQGWAEFVRDYAPVARTMLSHYFPALVPEVDGAVVDVFARARADNNSWFQSLHFANEREFTMTFRELVFTAGRSAARVPAPNLPADEIFALLDGLSLIQRQLFWAFLKGWDVGQVSAMLMNASATAEETSTLTTERLSKLSPQAPVERTVVALIAMGAAQQRKTEECPPWKTFNNLINGQISWDDRERVEIHMTGCMFCLDAFTAFQEMIWLRKESKPMDEAGVEAVLAPLRLGGPTSKGGLWRRVLSRAS
jgi:hypothetical protein